MGTHIALSQCRGHLAIVRTQGGFATLKRETSATVRAVILFSVVILGRGKVKTDARLFTAAIEAEAPIERPLPAQAQAVVPALLEANEPARSFPWERGDIPALTTLVLRGGSRRRAVSRRATSPGT